MIDFPDFKPGKLTTGDLRDLRSYQKRNELKVDGVFGHQTKGALFFENSALRRLLGDAERGAQRARAVAGLLAIAALLSLILHVAG